MSEIQGNNPKVGDANPSPEEQAKSQQKANLRDSQEQQKESNARDRKLCAGFVAGEKWVRSISEMIDAAFTNNDHLLQMSKDGKPFKTPEDYVLTRIVENTRDKDGNSILSIVVTKTIAKKLREHGVTVRKAAEALQTSNGTVSESNKGPDHEAGKSHGSDRRAPQPPSGEKSAAEVKAEKVRDAHKRVVASIKANQAVLDVLQHCTFDDLTTLGSDLVGLHKKVVTRATQLKAAMDRDAEKARKADEAKKAAAAQRAKVAAEKAAAKVAAAAPTGQPEQVPA